MSRNYQMPRMQGTDEDEINLLEMIGLIWFKWRVWVGASMIGCVLALVYVTFTPPIYESWATFFIPSNESSMLNKYASLFGGSEAGTLENKAMAIFGSDRLKLSISEKVYEAYPEVFQSKLKEASSKTARALTSPEIINIVKDHLELRDQLRVSKKKSGVFRVSSQNKIPEVSLLIINSALEEVSKIYNELEIGAKKSIITVLDTPALIKKPIKPKKMLTLLMGVFTCGLLGVVGIFFQNFIGPLKNAGISTKKHR